MGHGTTGLSSLGMYSTLPTLPKHSKEHRNRSEIMQAIKESPTIPPEILEHNVLFVPPFSVATQYQLTRKHPELKASGYFA